MTSTTKQDIEHYLQDLYNRYKTNPKELFGRLPLLERGVFEGKGYSVDCAPLPWMGNISTAELAIVSLEPLLSLASFESQCQLSQTYEGWRKLYFEHYENLAPDVPLQAYWNFMAAFLTAWSPKQDGTRREIRDTASFVEIPFCQYHAPKHASFKADQVFREDFIKRLSFFLSNGASNKKVLCLGAPIVDFLKREFQIDTNSFSNIITQDPQYFGTKRAIPLFAGITKIEGIDAALLFRRAPFANGFQPTIPALVELGHMVKNLQL